jgi:hypothetical protein
MIMRVAAMICVAAMRVRRGVRRELMFSFAHLVIRP